MQENSVQNQSLLQKKEDPELPDFLNWKPRRICEKSPLWGNKPGSQLCHRKPGINCSNTRSRRGSWDGQTAFCSTGAKQDPLSVGFWGAANSAARSKTSVPAPHPTCAQDCGVSQRCLLRTEQTVPDIVPVTTPKAWVPTECLWYHTEYLST